MAEVTEHGLITPDYGDAAAVPAAIAVNNEVTEKALTDIEADIEELKKKHEGEPTIIVMHDWDDTVIGHVVVQPWEDAAEVVNNYVRDNLIHPDLRSQTAEELASTERMYNYRGEYPYTEPDPDNPLATGGENTVTDGADYPLTNHLDYCLAGKTLNPDYPYIGCWVEVDPYKISDTFTALSSTQTIGYMPELDENGDPVNEGDTIPTLIAYDFSKIRGGGLNKILYLKAVFVPGAMWASNANGTGKSQYFILMNKEYRAEGYIETDGDCVCTLCLTYQAINPYGYGTERLKNGGVNYRAYSDENTIIARNPVVSTQMDKVEIKLFLSPLYHHVKYQFGSWPWGTLGASMQTRGIVYTEYPLTDNYDGYFNLAALGMIEDATRQYAEGNADDWYTNLSYDNFYYANIRGRIDGTEFTRAAQVTTVRKKLGNTTLTAMVAAGADHLNYYQIQYAILNKYAYVDADTAEAWCKANCTWCGAVIEEETE